jgi:hypothetical protein
MNTLNHYMLIHSGKIPFACNFCGEKIRERSHLRKHYRKDLPCRGINKSNVLIIVRFRFEILSQGT